MPKKILYSLETQKYTVEKISAHRQVGPKVQYLVHWRGYEEPTWEPDHNQTLKPMIEEYHKSLNDKGFKVHPAYFVLRKPKETK